MKRLSANAIVLVIGCVLVAGTFLGHQLSDFTRVLVGASGVLMVLAGAIGLRK
jgi:hypothetical protein